MTIKGQHLTEAAKEKMRISKLSQLQSKYKWDLVESYLDTEINISSNSNRSKSFITLRKYKELILNGNDLNTIKKEGISKHLLQFYSNLAQGKIQLTKEQFVLEYEQGLSLDEIAEKHKITRDDMTYLRQIFGEKKRGATFIERKRTEAPLTQRQKEILYGSMMGDAKKMSWSSAAFVHGEHQLDYLKWKYEEFKNVASEYSMKSTSYIDKTSEHKGVRHSFYTYANTDIEQCIREFYGINGKEINNVVLDKLTPLSIAVWFSDDGKTDFSHRTIINGNNSSPTFCFCTESFSEESCKLIQKWFLNKFNIKTRLIERTLSTKVGYRVAIDHDSNEIFIGLIEPHILPMFEYKIKYNEYVQSRDAKQTQLIMGDIFKCPLGADFSILKLTEQDKYITGLVNYFQEKGIYALIEKPDKWEDHVQSVININPNNLIREDYISFSTIGNQFLMSHFPNFWDSKAKGSLSPKEVFNNHRYLSEIIRTIITQGYFPNETKILKALHRYRGNKQISGFMPSVAKSIFHKYCAGNSKVIDFCAGYGGRLFGALTCSKVVSYTGIEVNFKTYCGLQDLHRDLRLNFEITKETNLFNQDSINGMKQFSDKYFDFCFTSPPYFDAEEYDVSDGQSCIQYSSYGSWFKDYLIRSIKESRRISKVVAINIANTGGYMIADDLERYLINENVQYRIDKLRLPKMGGDFRYEPIFIF